MKKLKSTETTEHIIFYDKIPKSYSNYNELIRLMEKRIKLLRRIESNHIPEVDLLQPKDFIDTDEDLLSHFYCRLVCSQSLWSLKWLVNAEVGYFRHRLKLLPENVIEKFFKENFVTKISSFDIKLNRIDQNSEYLISQNNTKKFNPETKIHFTKVTDLVSIRKVKLEDGYCSIENQHLKSILIKYFRDFLEKRMDFLYKHFVDLPDERYMKLQSKIFSVEQIDYSTKIATALKYSPPCIKGIVNKLSQKRHLKNSDRQTFSLYLKACGVSVEENISFMRNNYNVSRDVFDKEYLYSIRHNYGLEGKRANYPCHGCRKIIGNTGDSSTYGCPFVNNLKDVNSFLKENEINVPEIEDILVKKEYNIACTAVLKKLINKEEIDFIASPIEFYKKWNEEHNKNDENIKNNEQ